ncbi:MAG: citrate transporter, partial [Lachnospiraceae bacterium]|nr:citrate transporter [Lachnospiraceae bacterium]
MVTVLNFIKKEIVLVVSLVLAAVSALYVQPDTAYISYIDFRTLSILLSLMLTMAGLQKLSLFRQIGSFMVYRSHSIRSVILIFILLNFFFSMVITNDVALITFVPFTIVTLNLAGRKDLFIITIVLETIAANLGSMLTPLGNP